MGWEYQNNTFEKLYYFLDQYVISNINPEKEIF